LPRRRGSDTTGPREGTCSYPERGLALNPTAASILKLCNGELTVDGIVERLQREYTDRPGPELRQDVVEFVEEMARRGLLQVAG